jgi:hypothetical protein
MDVIDDAKQLWEITGVLNGKKKGRKEGKGRRALSRRQGFLAPAKPSEKYRQAIQAQGGKVFSETF